MGRGEGQNSLSVARRSAIWAVEMAEKGVASQAEFCVHPVLANDPDFLEQAYQKLLEKEELLEHLRSSIQEREDKGAWDSRWNLVGAYDRLAEGLEERGMSERAERAREVKAREEEALQPLSQEEKTPV